ncbi:hypothetical protein [Massilia sp. BHUDP2]|uniref:hypothetical protein n=1 Tax=Massilia sp. BHUDP2 TaxID=3034505 RepID=UPI00390618F9
MRAVLLGFLLCAATTAQAKSLFTFSNPAGTHGVGVRYLKQVDRTRPFTPQRGMLARAFSMPAKRGR